MLLLEFHMRLVGCMHSFSLAKQKRGGESFSILESRLYQALQQLSEFLLLLFFWFHQNKLRGKEVTDIISFMTLQ